MTPDELAAKIDDAYEVELRAIKDGSAATTPEGKPASSLKERTELLKAAAEWHTARKTPDSEWGKHLTGKAGANGG